MMRKILTLALCALVVLSLVCCTEKKTVENNDVEIKNEPATDETFDDNQKTEEKTKVELDIKPLEEIDEQVLMASAEKLGFKNKNLFHAFANAIGKNPGEVTQEDVDKIHYVALGPDDDENYSLFVGYIDYVDMCFSDAASEPDFMNELNKLVMMSEIVYEKDSSLSDLGNFKNVEMFEIYDVAVDDLSFVKEYDSLALGYFKNNGITDVSVLADYNPESLIELDFTGNDIENWEPLMHIKDKVIVIYDMQSGFVITLDSYLEQTQNSENNSSEEKEAETKTEVNADKDDKDAPAFVDENGNPVDFGSLFD